GKIENLAVCKRSLTPSCRRGRVVDLRSRCYLASDRPPHGAAQQRHGMRTGSSRGFPGSAWSSLHDGRTSHFHPAILSGEPPPPTAGFYLTSSKLAERFPGEATPSGPGTRACRAHASKDKQGIWPEPAILSGEASDDHVVVFHYSVIAD